MWHLAEESGGLDLNSPYAYLLAAHHFASTSVVADADGRLAGFVLAYSPQDQTDTVFVWQVATHPDFRGLGLGKRMLHEVIDRAMPRGVTSMTATVTPSNDASRSLFNAVARDRETGCTERPCFGAELFPGEGHEPEHEIHIGPLPGADTHDR